MDLPHVLLGGGEGGASAYGGQGCNLANIVGVEDTREEFFFCSMMDWKLPVLVINLLSKFVFIYTL